MEQKTASEPCSDLWRHRATSTLVLAGAFVLTAIAILGAAAPAGGSHLPAFAQVSPNYTAGSAIAPNGIPALGLGISATPQTICAYGLGTCAAGNGLARVTMTASAGPGGVVAWPAVQVAFVIETTLYDGVYDPSAGEPGTDPCADAGGPACEESNGVPFFIAHAQQIANAIAQANPHSQVSFAMVDYFATINSFDDGDGSEYHVDIQDFVQSSYFGQSVVSTFQTEVLGGGFVYSDSDFSDNILHSSVITALYGTIIGSGLTWSNNTHHVIVWMGSTAPRDPNYPENYCVSPSTYANFYTGSACIGSVCEPSYTFATGVSPNCEGWVKSQDGNVNDSIAALAHTAPACTGSIGGVCTVDVINPWTTPTDPYSKGWPSGRTGGGPGGPKVIQDVNNVLLAGCDLAQATGGTWDGPSYFTCPDGQTGSLVYVAHGSVTRPNTDNPSLFNAFRQIGFGPILQTQVAAGTSHPIFSFVPVGSIQLAPTDELQPTATCLRQGVVMPTCDRTPVVIHQNGVVFLGWNWSTNKTKNVMYVGDQWMASFNVIASGPPYSTVPVDACTTPTCKAGGSASVNGLYTWASYEPYTNNTVVTLSFPLATVGVEVTPPLASPVQPPPPPPPPPPPFAIPTAPPVPVIQQVGVGNTVGIANVSLQATAAGFLGAGFTRVGLKNRPIAMKMASMSGKNSAGSRFDRTSAKDQGPGLGRFE